MRPNICPGCDCSRDNENATDHCYRFCPACRELINDGKITPRQRRRLTEHYASFKPNLDTVHSHGGPRL